MRRIPDVLDVWFDSGSMPFAQVHYPFENQEWFDSHNPADFIVEYIGQTRGWFYVMHVLSTALFDRPAFKNVISHGIVLGSDGQKMSKSLRNYPDVSEVFDRDGSDAMRWFLMSSSVLRGGNLVVTEEGIREGVRQFLLPLWSTYYFFTLYANTAAIGRPGELGYEASGAPTRPTCSTATCSRRLRELVDEVTDDLEAFDSPLAAAKLRDFADVLTNWYVRRIARPVLGRRRATATAARPSTRSTPCSRPSRGSPRRSCRSCREEVWRGLTGGRSVHLADWPDADEFPADDALVAAMDAVREISGAGPRAAQAGGPPRAAAAREPHGRDHGCRGARAVRGHPARRAQREGASTSSPLDGSSAERLRHHASGSRVNARAAGPRLGKTVQQAIQAARAGDWSARRRHGRRGRHRARAGRVRPRARGRRLG